MNRLRTLASSYRFTRALSWVAAFVLAAGVVAVLVAFFGDDPPPKVERFSNRPANVVKTPKTVPVPPEARRVAGKFILTAVARKNLAASWPLTHPELRAGLSRREWMTGNIPVVPYPVDELDVATFKVDWSYPNDVSLRVALLPKPGSAEKPQIFIIGLKRVQRDGRKRWLVSYWAPYSTLAIPDNPAEG